MLQDSHVSSASGTAWKEGHMDFTGRTECPCIVVYQIALHLSRIPPSLQHVLGLMHSSCRRSDGPDLENDLSSCLLSRWSQRCQGNHFAAQQGTAGQQHSALRVRSTTNHYEPGGVGIIDCSACLTVIHSADGESQLTCTVCCILSFTVSDVQSNGSNTA